MTGRGWLEWVAGSWIVSIFCWGISSAYLPTWYWLGTPLLLTTGWGVIVFVLTLIMIGLGMKYGGHESTKANEPVSTKERFNGPAEHQPIKHGFTRTEPDVPYGMVPKVTYEHSQTKLFEAQKEMSQLKADLWTERSKRQEAEEHRETEGVIRTIRDWKDKADAVEPLKGTIKDLQRELSNERIDKNILKKQLEQYKEYAESWSQRVERRKVTEAFRRRIFERDHGKCQQCGKVALHPEIDHINPIVKGGKTTEENCQLLCRGCNRRKGAS